MEREERENEMIDFQRTDIHKRVCAERIMLNVEAQIDREFPTELYDRVDRITNRAVIELDEALHARELEDDDYRSTEINRKRREEGTLISVGVTIRRKLSIEVWDQAEKIISKTMDELDQVINLSKVL